MIDDVWRGENLKKWAMPIGIIVAAIGIFIYNNSQVLNGTQEMIDKAREIIPITEADTADISYVGMVGVGDEVMMWFISTDEHQDMYYLPMECRYVGNRASSYKYVDSHKPDEVVDDIAQIHWKDMYLFLVNNPDCKTVKITYNGDETTAEEIEVNGYPFMFEHSPKAELVEYAFLDADRNEM